MFPARLYMIGDLIFARQTTIGAVSDEALVEIDQMHAFGTFHTQYESLPFPLRGDSHLSPVETYRASLRNLWWNFPERHLNIRVMRQVSNVLQGPVTGHSDSARSTRHIC